MNGVNMNGVNMHIVRSSTVVASAMLLLASGAAARGAVGVGDSPTLNVRSIDGKPLTLKQYKGKLIVVDFWATWCGPCMGEAAHMVEVNKRYADRGLQFIGVSLDEDQAQLRAIIKEKNFTWPQFFDGQGWKNQLAQAWGVDSIPRTFLIGPDGKVVWTGHPAEIDAALERAYKETPPVLVDPSVAAEAKAKLDALDAALKSGQLSTALSAFATVPAEANQDPKLAERVTASKASLDAAAGKAIADVETLVTQKRYGEADAQLKAIADALGDSPNGKAAQARRDALATDPAYVAQRDAAEQAAKQAEVESTASTALTSAEGLQAAKKDVQAYNAFATIVRLYPKTAACGAAAKAVAAYDADPKMARRLADAKAKGTADGLLSLARGYVASKRSDLARAKYQAIIDQFPKSSFADTARAELATLD